MGPCVGGAQTRIEACLIDMRPVCARPSTPLPTRREIPGYPRQKALFITNKEASSFITLELGSTRRSNIPVGSLSSSQALGVRGLVSLMGLPGQTRSSKVKTFFQKDKTMRARPKRLKRRLPLCGKTTTIRDNFAGREQALASLAGLAAGGFSPLPPPRCVAPANDTSSDLDRERYDGDGLGCSRYTIRIVQQ